MPAKWSRAGSSSAMLVADDAPVKAIETNAAAAEPKFGVCPPEIVDKFDHTKMGAFLMRCYYCTKRMAPNSDTYMYGDCAFCSVACREIQMKLDIAAQKKRNNPK